MKKVIWVFGESATGKKTLILDLLKSTSNIKHQLDLQGKKIDVVRLSIEETNESFDDKNSEIIRNSKIMECIECFLKSDNEVLLIKGQANDMDDRYGNTLKCFAEKYPLLEKEILLLEVEDLDILYERIVNKSWFKEDVERYSKLFPRTWIDRAVLKHRNKIESFAKYGFKILRIDSTNEFNIKDKGLINNG